MKIKPATCVHKEFQNDMKLVLAKHHDTLTGMEMLALCAHLVGVVLAAQDPKKGTMDQALAVIGKNIELGNEDAMRPFMETIGNA